MNLKTKVIAAEVGNLTDARYFAAWGVDYISYSLDKDSDQYIGEEAIKEIIDWVEGPLNLANLSGINIPKQFDVLFDQLKLDGIIAGPFLEDKNLHDYSQRIINVVVDLNMASDIKEHILIARLHGDENLEQSFFYLKELCNNNEVYLDTNFTKPLLDKLLKNVNLAGIVLRGGKEEKTGFKSYDQLDEIFEYLEE